MPDVLVRFREPDFRAAILPAAMRTVLLALRDDDEDQDDDPDSWAQRWFRFASALAGEERPAPDEPDRSGVQRFRGTLRPCDANGQSSRPKERLMSRPIRRLNERGREAFRAWLEAGALGTPPFALLDDPATSGPLHRLIPRPTGIYESRYDLGVDLVDLLEGLELTEVQLDAGLWDWLSLCLIDQTCPPDQAGRRKPGQIDRHLLRLESHQTRYRHLVRTAWRLVRVHGSAVRFILGGPLHVHGEAAEQLCAYRDVVTCKPLIAALGQLVWDPEKARFKRGFAGSGPGSARRVHVVSEQFRLTYDLDAMQPSQILGLLPREFDRFREPPSSPRPRPRARQPAQRGPLAGAQERRGQGAPPATR